MDHYFPDVPGLGNVAVSSTRRRVWSRTGFRSTTSKRRYSTAAPPPMGKTFSGEKRMASEWSFFDNRRHSKERCWQRPCIVSDQPLALRSDPPPCRVRNSSGVRNPQDLSGAACRGFQQLCIYSPTTPTTRTCSRVFGASNAVTACSEPSNPTLRQLWSQGRCRRSRACHRLRGFVHGRHDRSGNR
jgi:hypothetical protein